MIPSAKTALYGLIGTPIGHSFSPKMHNTAFDYVGEDACYLAFDTSLEELDQTVKALKQLGVKGWNVTMPLKTEMVRLCDELSPEAELIGAVNTIVNNNGKLKGYSTDGIGFFANARDNSVNVVDKNIVMIGAGGAARSIAAQAMFEGINRLVIYNRTFEKAQELVREIAQEAEIADIKLKAGDLNDLDNLEKDIREADLIINATSVGMTPGSNEIIINPDWLRADQVVADVVYTPVKTRLQKEASDKGCIVLDGLGMVLWQGAYSFKYWTGKEFPIKLVKDNVFGTE